MSALLPTNTRHTNRGLLISAAGAVLLALITNGIVFAAGWNSESDSDVQVSFAPPGWVVGSIWVVLFAFMGSARWLARNDSKAKDLITFLIVACALYPFYTGGLETQWVALAGTLVTILISVLALLRARNVSTTSTLLIAPVIIWSVFAAAIITEGLRLN